MLCHKGWKMERFFAELNIWVVLRSATEVFLIFLMLYLVLRFMQGTRGMGILRGLVFFLVIASVVLLFIVRKLQLYTVDWLLTEFLPIVTIPLIILFQPEFRRALVRLGQSPFFGIFLKEEPPMMDEVVKAATNLAKNRLGAIIAIERKVGLDNFIEGGVRINADVSSDLISTIFWPGSPLHDGAVIIHEQRIAAAGCLLPLSDSPTVDKALGTRHRAAIGLTEETDAVSIIVSEETGVISLAVKGQITRGYDEKGLKKALGQLFYGKDSGEAIAERSPIR